MRDNYHSYFVTELFSHVTPGRANPRPLARMPGGR